MSGIGAQESKVLTPPGWYLCTLMKNSFTSGSLSFLISNHTFLFQSG